MNCPSWNLSRVPCSTECVRPRNHVDCVATVAVLASMFNDVALHALLTRHHISILIHHGISNWQLTSCSPRTRTCMSLPLRKIFFTSSWTWKIGFFSNLTKMPCCKLQRQTIYYIVLYLLQVNAALNKVLKVIFK